MTPVRCDSLFTGFHTGDYGSNSVLNTMGYKHIVEPPNFHIYFRLYLPKATYMSSTCNAMSNFTAITDSSYKMVRVPNLPFELGHVGVRVRISGFDEIAGNGKTACVAIRQELHIKTFYLPPLV